LLIMDLLRGWTSEDFDPFRYVSSWDYSQLDPFKADSFKFSEKTTPFGTWHWPVYGAFIYLFVILLGQKLMSFRSSGFSVSFLAQCHNLILCLMSLIMFLGAVIGVFKHAKKATLFEFMCSADPEPMKGYLAYWMYIFYVSKFYEYLDTVILVLKKKELRLLHLWHHFVVGFLAFSWIPGKWFFSWIALFQNSLVHVFMYYYYFVSQAFGMRPFWGRYITQGQILQFMNVFVCIWIWFYYRLVKGKNCVGDIPTIVFAQGVNISFLFLFIQLYRSSYNTKKPANNAKKTE